MDSNSVTLLTGVSYSDAFYLAEEFEQLGAVVEIFITATGHEHEIP